MSQMLVYMLVGVPALAFLSGVLALIATAAKAVRSARRAVLAQP